MVGAYQAYVYSRKAKNYQQKKSNQILGIYMVSLLLIGTMQDFFRDIPVFCVSQVAGRYCVAVKKGDTKIVLFVNLIVQW